jgi:hypothetical protein
VIKIGKNCKTGDSVGDRVGLALKSGHALNANQITRTTAIIKLVCLFGSSALVIGSLVITRPFHHHRL